MRFFPASDHSLLVYLGKEIGLPTHFRVVALLNTLQRKPIPFVTNVQPAYCSLLLTFDPLATSHRQLERSLRSYAVISKGSKPSKPRRIVISVCYGGVFGPDLEAVARDKNLSPQQVIELHSSTIYHSYFLDSPPALPIWAIYRRNWPLRGAPLRALALNPAASALRAARPAAILSRLPAAGT